jgi:hypothetical protein
MIIVTVSAAINLLLLALLFYMIRSNQKERRFYLDFIDRLQNKLMSRDFTEYTLQSRAKTGKNISNPLMSNIQKQVKERTEQMLEDEQL